MLWRTGRGTVRARVAGAVRGTHLGSFAVIMATGIVSSALRAAGRPHLSAALLAIAAAGFVILASASALRAAAFPADLRRDLARPASAFTNFAFVAACGVLGNRLASDGHDGAATVLAAAALGGWLALTCLVPGRMAVHHRDPPAVTDISGNWYLWAVGTQSLVIAAAFLAAGGLIRPQPTTLVAVTAWSAGVMVYLLITVLVAVRLVLAGLGPQDPTAPYWVAMGGASITALAAAQILHGPGLAALGAARPVLTAAAVIFWAVASSLIPLLIARGVWRHLARHEPLRYRGDLWTIVFPAGMYATASMELGTAVRLPLVHGIGAVAAWPAAAAWALTFAAMIVSLVRRPPWGRVPGADRPVPEPPGNLYRDTISLTGRRRSLAGFAGGVDEMKRYKFQALVTLGPAPDGGLAAMSSGQMRRAVVRGHHHDTGSSKFFSALVTKQGEQAWPEQDPVIMTVALMADDPGEYFEIGDSFAFWLGHDLGRGVVTRRLFV